MTKAPKFGGRWISIILIAGVFIEGCRFRSKQRARGWGRHRSRLYQIPGVSLEVLVRRHDRKRYRPDSPPERWSRTARAMALPLSPMFVAMSDVIRNSPWHLEATP